MNGTDSTHGDQGQVEQSPEEIRRRDGRITVLGAGSWGLALATALARNNCQVTVWGHRPERIRELESTLIWDPASQEIRLPEAIRWETDLQTAIQSAEGITLAIPSSHFRTIARALKGFQGIVISGTKGIEFETGLTMCGILEEEAPDCKPVALSGPTLALEVMKRLPSAIVAASQDSRAAEVTQSWFHSTSFRVYTNMDRLGVELGGALKNVVAIAAGVVDGLKYGDNSKAALVTRSIAEIRRLGEACGAVPETFAGLSGLGDLMVTCFSPLSRNRTFGERLGSGESIRKALESGQPLVEGFPTARSAYRLAKEMGVTAPIIREVYLMLHEHKRIPEAVNDLMSRSSKAED